MTKVNAEQIEKLFELMEKLAQRPQSQSEFGGIIVYAIGVLIIAGLTYAVFLKIWEGIKLKNGKNKNGLIFQQIETIESDIDELKKDMNEHKKENSENFDRMSDKFDKVNENMSQGFAAIQTIVINALSKTL